MKFLRRYYSQLLFLITGILVGFFISRLPLKFEEKISWITLANFFLTILLALYLEFVVRPSISNNRSEKDLLIDLLKDIRKQITEVHEQYALIRSNIPIEATGKTELIAKFRVLSNQIDLFKKSDEYCTITKKSTISDKVFNLYIQYKKALTGYGFNNVNFAYDRLYWKQHESNYQALITGVTHSIIDVNKL